MENQILTPQKQTTDDFVIKISQYIQKRALPLLKPLQTQILLKRPQNVAKFALQWLQQQKLKTQQRKQQRLNQFQQSQDDEDIDEKIKKKIKKQKQFGLKTRSGILGDKSNQQYKKLSIRQSNVQIIDWSEQIKVNLFIYLKKSIFFKHLDTNSMQNLIKHMKLIQFQQYETIIHEGDQGKVQCLKDNEKNFVRYMQIGELFGELSLLYNNPRSMSIIGVQKGQLFSLSRKHFHSILRIQLYQRIKQCQQVANKVELFHNLSLYQRSKLFQSMEIVKIAPQKFVIKEGQVGNCLFLVAQGNLVAYKRRGSQDRLVKTYKKGDYFGQLALLQDSVRQASVKAITQSKLFFINKQAFSRILGSLESILKRNQQLYLRLNPTLNWKYHQN